MDIRSIAVFCGSHKGNNPVYAKHAQEMGKLIAMLGVKLIYGGGHKGLMGILADAVLEHGGQVMGVIPELLIEWEAQHKGLTELSIVPDMHTRKRMIYERADVVIMMPGGFGTLDEFFEILTWNQLNIHNKKIYVLNSDGFFNHLKKHIAQLLKEGFLYEAGDSRIIFCNSPVEVFNQVS
jgi:uncharacterized protein (TIGR00730 family)